MCFQSLELTHENPLETLASIFDKTARKDTFPLYLTAAEFQTTAYIWLSCAPRAWGCAPDHVRHAPAATQAFSCFFNHKFSKENSTICILRAMFMQLSQ
jgi:hypothetical protein